MSENEMLLQLRGIQKRNGKVSVTIHIINLSTAMTDGFGEMKRQPDWRWMLAITH